MDTRYSLVWTGARQKFYSFMFLVILVVKVDKLEVETIIQLSNTKSLVNII